MINEYIAPGDVVHAATDLLNDGSHPKYAPEEVVVPSGTRGVVVRIGHAELDERQELLLVRFEQSDGILGPPVGCWPSEIVTPEPVTPETAS